MSTKKTNEESRDQYFAPIKNCKYEPNVSKKDYEDLKEFQKVQKALSCPETWQNLKETDENNVRLCDKCERSVYLVTNDEELGKSIRLNQCIAWQLPEDILKKYKGLRFAMGQPELQFGPVTRKLMFK